MDINIMVEKGQGMWKKLKKIRVNEKLIFSILLIGIVITLIPMLIVAQYNVPSADDYTFGVNTHLAWERSHSLSDVLKESVQMVKECYFTWQGGYTGTFVGTLQPAIFGEKWYALTTYIMLISLCGGIIYFVAVVFRRILNAAWYQTGIVTVVILASCIQLLPSPVEGFYWYDGAVGYTFFFGISLIIYAKVLTYIYLSDAALSPVKKVLRLLSLSILCAIVAGTNYVTTLTMAILFTCVLAFLVIQKKRSSMGLVVPFCVFMTGFLTNILAPGNSTRQAAVGHHPSALLSIPLSLCTAAYYLLDWLSPVLLILVIFLIPLLYKIAAKTNYSYSHPIFVSFGSFCLFASMFCPSIYATGKRGPDRLLNIVYYAFVILLIANLFYILGWYQRRTKTRSICTEVGNQESECKRSAYSGAFLSTVVFLTLVILLGSALAGSYYTSGKATLDLVQGHAQAYYETAMERVELLTDDSQQDVVLPRYPVKPRVLFWADISADPASGHNSISKYYQKNTVILGPERITD